MKENDACKRLAPGEQINRQISQQRRTRVGCDHGNDYTVIIYRPGRVGIWSRPSRLQEQEQQQQQYPTVKLSQKFF